MHYGLYSLSDEILIKWLVVFALLVQDEQLQPGNRHQEENSILDQNHVS